MSKLRPVMGIVVLIAAIAIVWLLLSSSKREPVLSGYIEAENLYLAAPVSGTLQSIDAVEGGRAQPGERLFKIDPATLSAQGEQAEANVAAARTQIASAEANAQQANADVAAAEADGGTRAAGSCAADERSPRRFAAVAGKDIDQPAPHCGRPMREWPHRAKTARARRAQVVVAQSQAAEASGGKREVAIRVDQLSPAVPPLGPGRGRLFPAGRMGGGQPAGRQL